MAKPAKPLAERAKEYWERRELSVLEELRKKRGAEKNSEVLYFVGLALNALNKRREAIECWRKAREIDPQNEAVIRTLAYELMEQAPVDAAKLFGELIGQGRADADDYCCLGEIRIKQDRLGEACRWLEESLRLQPDNSLALVAMASLYTQVCDSALALDYLQRAADTGDIDLSDLASDPEFEVLWRDPKFETIVSAIGR